MAWQNQPAQSLPAQSLSSLSNCKSISLRQFEWLWLACE
jgi:hypothetical protein